MSGLRGRTALVTGAQGGIGAEICASLAQAGARVVGVDLRASESRQPSVENMRLDVTDEDGWSDLAVRVEREYGALDILVHNAGLALTERIEATSVSDFRRVMAVNVEGPLIGTKAFLGLLRRTGGERPDGASIVMVSSIMGIVGGAFCSAYSASKGAVRSLSKSLAVEFASSDTPSGSTAFIPAPSTQGWSTA